MLGDTKDEILNSFKVKLEAEHGKKITSIQLDFNFVTGSNTILINLEVGEEVKDELSKTESFFIKNLFLGKIKKSIKEIDNNFNSLNWVIVEIIGDTNIINLYSEYITHSGDVTLYNLNF